MHLLPRSFLPFAALLAASMATAQEARFLEWNIQMSTPRLESGAPTQLKNVWKPGKVMGGHEPLSFSRGRLTVGIDLKWWDKPNGYTDIRFEFEAPGLVTPGKGPITFARKVAIKVGPSGYLQQGDNRISTVDLVFSAKPVYEWHVINMAPLSDGITRNHKIGLLNVKKRAFLIYQSRRIGFELGWWRYYPPLPVQVAATAKPGSPYYGYKSNIGEILPFLETLDKVSPGESRFLRNFFGIKRT